jgi:hypothetical protein
MRLLSRSPKGRNFALIAATTIVFYVGQATFVAPLFGLIFFDVFDIIYDKKKRALFKNNIIPWVCCMGNQCRIKSMQVPKQVEIFVQMLKRKKLNGMHTNAASHC